MYYKDYPYCWPFIIGAFFIVVIGRYFGIVCSYYMFNCAKGSDNNTLSFAEISVATYAAFIRGAIAFGLVEMLDEHTFKYKRVIVSSVMVLVISTTCIFGGFTPIVVNYLLPTKKIDVVDMDALTSENSSNRKDDRDHGSAGTA
jgi:NhaP-type Na+/H+ or K+/H+ antiporter